MTHIDLEKNEKTAKIREDAFFWPGDAFLCPRWKNYAKYNVDQPSLIYCVLRQIFVEKMCCLLVVLSLFVIFRLCIVVFSIQALESVH